MSKLYRILYCSRGILDPARAPAEIRQILAVSRVNNERDGISGGLFFSQQSFAQVLEGPADKVEAAFERIQCDARHSDVVILEAGATETRDFPNWSMAFAGESDDQGFGGAILKLAFSGQTLAGDTVLNLLRSVVVREDEWLSVRAA